MKGIDYDKIRKLILEANIEYVEPIPEGSELGIIIPANTPQNDEYYLELKPSKGNSFVIVSFDLSVDLEVVGNVIVSTILSPVDKPEDGMKLFAGDISSGTTKSKQFTFPLICNKIWIYGRVSDLITTDNRFVKLISNEMYEAKVRW